MVLKSINPTTEDVVETFEEFSPAQIDAALQQAYDAQRRWRKTSFGERSARLQNTARALRAQKSRLAALATREMGKPIVEAEAEVEKCAYNCDFYAEHAATFLADEHVQMNLSDSFVAFEPLGVVLAIMPWNFPFWQVFRFAAPALMAGNGAVLKHASNVPSCALAIEDILRTAGLPDGLLRTVLVPGSGVEPLIADPRIAAVTLTGSSEVGERVAGAAGRHLKKQVLELGGSDPFIVLADADLDAAVKVAVRARNQNNGQSCIAAKRFIVEAGAADQFTEKFAATVKALHVGDPMQRETNIGPLARGDLRETLATQVERTVKAGAHALTGGASLDGKGYFYAPTVLDGVSQDMPAFREETFGPVAAVIRARDPEAAVKLANDTEYGLGAALWTGNVERGKDLARHIEAGNVFINGMVASDPRIPFGGIKRSGYGRELGSYGIKEFVNIQTIVVGQPAAPPPPAE
ncbi:MAG: NAD-dependent succinate-semialdehyde dehydrogenase [Chloroflexi bacterium]|nr:NAD-dependent succinate-semialdehyde dehydrogenase [Chloroflexota bacterium]MBV9596721.1 NAD-dependent succinate-semialdehyde dehydrogenase [Chloroflexota bacterium]